MRDGEHAPYAPLLAFGMNRLVAAWNARLAARLATAGLSLAEWRVLMVAADAPPMTIMDLAEHTLVPHSTLSRQLAAMERDGLLTRRAAAADGRATEIALTPRGRARYREVRPLAEAELAAGLAGLTRAEIATLGTLLARIATTLDAAS